MSKILKKYPVLLDVFPLIIYNQHVVFQKLISIVYLIKLNRVCEKEVQWNENDVSA